MSDLQPEGQDKRESREYRYECANGHTWISTPVERMRCCVCGTVTLHRLKPVDAYDEMARQLWVWNGEHGGMGYPYDRLIDLTKDDLRALARRLAPFVLPKDRAAESEARQAELERERAALVEALRETRKGLEDVRVFLWRIENGKRSAPMQARSALTRVETALVVTARAGVVEAEPDGSER